MSDALHLTVSTPMEVLVKDLPVVAIRAEDASGSFGILPGHTDFLTVLPPSVLRWRESADAAPRYCAIRAGLMTVTGGTKVAVACREGILGADLEALRAELRALRKDATDEDRRARVEHLRLHAQAVRQMMRFLRPARPGAFDHPPAIGVSVEGDGDGW
ncbi:MAG: F0F1 ATP synthase subunit epsilon [Thioclava marina]|jgi:alternate F1F0 ATPase, F1 subunit epsilon|uniref:F0F1 ATP synthase subunit epsilon n=1 Tax=Thioclava marina TaxID=1915077 RepID=UPI00198D135C|nr:F0F1 ATP synthase subunit epsilon [Thioclava marina]MBC7144057.1 F0F1 ATP synthase subunit epsilon [Thioclava marina]